MPREAALNLQRDVATTREKRCAIASHVEKALHHTELQSLVPRLESVQRPRRGDGREELLSPLVIHGAPVVWIHQRKEPQLIALIRVGHAR